MGFEKFNIFARNPKVLAYGFTENCQFGAKTDRNSVFLAQDPLIVNRLSVMVPYFNFYGFWKTSHFCSKSKGVSLRFYQKLPVWGKTWPKLRISWSWPPYCELVTYNGPVFQFLRVLKNFTFLLKMQRCQPTVLPKIASLGQKLTETPYFWVVTPVLRIGYL
jgi:hypothetical protein